MSLGLAPDPASTYKGFGSSFRLADVLECQRLSMILLSKLVMSLILEKLFVVLEYFPASLKVLEQL